MILKYLKDIDYYNLNYEKIKNEVSDNISLFLNPKKESKNKLLISFHVLFASTLIFLSIFLISFKKDSFENKEFLDIYKANIDLLGENSFLARSVNLIDISILQNSNFNTGNNDLRVKDLNEESIDTLVYLCLLKKGNEQYFCYVTKDKVLEKRHSTLHYSYDDIISKFYEVYNVLITKEVINDLHGDGLFIDFYKTVEGTYKEYYILCLNNKSYYLYL